MIYNLFSDVIVINRDIERGVSLADVAGVWRVYVCIITGLALVVLVIVNIRIDWMMSDSQMLHNVATSVH